MSEETASASSPEDRLAGIDIRLALTETGFAPPRMDLWQWYHGDVGFLRSEVDQLRRWKAEAMEVMSGLEDLGKALELPLGESITGTVAAGRVARLKEALEALGRERNTWARQMADLRDEMETAAERARQDADNANETERILRAEVELRRELVEQAAYQGRRTTLDPGAFVARGRDDDGDYERMDQWRERALRHGLAKIWEAAEERRAGQ